MESAERSNAERAALPPIAAEPGGASRRRVAGRPPPALAPVLLLPSGEKVALSALLRDRATRARYLRDHHGNAGGVLCLCRNDGIPMGVARRQAPEETFYLYPLHRADPSRHATACPHFVGDSGHGGREAGKPVVESDGTRIRVNLTSPVFTIHKSSFQSHEKASTCDATKDHCSQKGAGLLTLLQVLWAEAGLNVWRPGFVAKRGYGLVVSRLCEAARRIDVKTAELGPLFYVPPPFRAGRGSRSGQALTDLLEALKPDGKGRRWFGYVGGLLRKAERPREGSVALHLAHGPCPVWASALPWAKLLRARLDEDDEEGFAGAPEFVLLRVLREEGRNGPWLRLEEFAALGLADTRCWIPVESARERELALALVAGGRRFRKPLYPDGELGPVVPSFVLEDRRHPIPCRAPHPEGRG